MDLLDDLDDQQRQVATHFGGPVCVLAGAGTGKTRSITYRIANAVRSGVSEAEHILALTFTTKAAAEMAQRVQALNVAGVSARTFHSAALRQLQHFWPTVTGGMLPDIQPSKAALIAKALDTMKIQVDQAVLRDMAGDIEWRKGQGLSLDEYLGVRSAGGGSGPGGLSWEVLADVHERYEVVKDEARRIDFEDVLLATVGMLETEKRVLEHVRAQYRSFVVDEYQDVSPLQQRLLELWLGDRTDIVVVGDASQTIYTFAGASSEYLLDFADRYDDALVVKLEKNYRSGPHIVALANDVMAGQRGALTLQATQGDPIAVVRHHASTDEAEAQFVARTLREFHDAGVDYNDCAILMRFGAQSLVLEQALRAEGISFRVQGSRSFFDEPHIKRAVMEIRGAAVAGVPGDLSTVVADILFGLGLTGEEPEHQGAERDRFDDLAAVKALADDADKTTTVREFSDMLVARMAAGDSPGVGALTLSTVHSAKGQEWPVVFMVGLAEGLFPISYAKTPAAIEEERRLFYVGVTRARQRLVLSFADSHKQSSSPREASRFLRDISPG